MSFNNTERAELVIDSPEQLVVVFGKLLGVVAPNCSVGIEPLSEAAILFGKLLSVVAPNCSVDIEPLSEAAILSSVRLHVSSDRVC
jgi:hypothetical protein